MFAQPNSISLNKVCQEKYQWFLAGLSAAVQTCTERIEAEVAKLQVDVDLRATEEGASELRRSIVLITEQLQALTSQEEQGMQDLNSKLAAQTTSTEELRFTSLFCGCLQACVTVL